MLAVPIRMPRHSGEENGQSFGHAQVLSARIDIIFAVPKPALEGDFCKSTRKVSLSAS